MGNTLVFVCGEAARCEEMTAPFAEAGWQTKTVSAESSDALAAIEAEAPVATVFDLEAGHGAAIQSIAAALMSDPNVSRPLLVFVGGDQATVAILKEDVPFGVFVKTDELAWVLKHLTYKD